MSYFLIFVGALSRLLPHPANFTPVTALALFGGSRLPKKQAFFVPLIAMIISDIGLHFVAGYPFLTGDSLFVYASLILVSVLGMWLQKGNSFSRFLLASISSVAIFFVVSNFGTWLTSGIYPRTLNGFVSCYIAAIPFVRSSLFGDLAWIAIFFGSSALVTLKVNKSASLQSQSLSR